jgi:hypothetical protein
MGTKSEKRSFDKRAFVSIAMFVSGLFLPYSGLMNHKLQFESLNQTRHYWMSVHNMSAVLFLIFAIIHITMNGKSLKKYINKIKGAIISKEAIAAIILVTFVVGMFSLHVLHVE